MIVNLISKINRVERLAASSKLKRLLYNPLKYISAIVFNQFVYPITKKEKVKEAILFYGRKIKVALPASTDIYLTGGKSHDSEIRLAKFIIRNLKENNHFLDIGAHYGYFTLLASEITGNHGKVIAFEPASKSYQLLQENVRALGNVVTYQKAVSDSNKNLEFYEFPNLYSEYNSFDVSQFKSESWFQDSKPQKVDVLCTRIDDIVDDKEFRPDIIKIDVEGAECNVIQGGLNYFQKYAPKIVMEYLAPERKNNSHKKALELLLNLNYKSYRITPAGELDLLQHIDNYLADKNLESDNIVFIKGNFKAD